jgi:hypothetical protein
MVHRDTRLVVLLHRPNRVGARRRQRVGEPHIERSHRVLRRNVQALVAPDLRHQGRRVEQGGHPDAAQRLSGEHGIGEVQLVDGVGGPARLQHPPGLFHRVMHRDRHVDEYAATARPERRPPPRLRLPPATAGGARVALVTTARPHHSTRRRDRQHLEPLRLRRPHTVTRPENTRQLITRAQCATRRLVISPAQLGELGRRFLGLMANLKSKD